MSSDSANAPWSRQHRPTKTRNANAREWQIWLPRSHLWIAHARSQFPPRQSLFQRANASVSTHSIPATSKTSLPASATMLQSALIHNLSRSDQLHHLQLLAKSVILALVLPSGSLVWYLIGLREETAVPVRTFHASAQTLQLPFLYRCHPFPPLSANASLASLPTLPGSRAATAALMRSSWEPSLSHLSLAALLSQWNSLACATMSQSAPLRAMSSDRIATALTPLLKSPLAVWSTRMTQHATARMWTLVTSPAAAAFPNRSRLFSFNLSALQMHQSSLADANQTVRMRPALVIPRNSTLPSLIWQLVPHPATVLQQTRAALEHATAVFPSPNSNRFLKLALAANRLLNANVRILQQLTRNKDWFVTAQTGSSLTL